MLGSASSQGATIGLIMARAAGAARRAEGGSSLTEMDQGALRKASELLRTTADALQFAESDGKAGSRPRNFTAVEFVVETKFVRSEPQEQWVAVLGKLADDVDAFALDGGTEAAPRLVALFSTLSEMATRNAGSVGELARQPSRP